jgi:L-rhamnose mutarotase
VPARIDFVRRARPGAESARLGSISRLAHAGRQRRRGPSSFMQSNNRSNSRQRICFCLQVKPDRLAEYKERHRAVWPEMLDALTAAGWGNYSLFLRDDGLLIGYLETPDFDRALAEMARTDVNRRWQDQMADFFVSKQGRKADECMRPIPEVFHLP